MRTSVWLILTVGLAPALPAEAPSSPTPPSPHGIQDSQQRLGDQIGRIGASLEDLLEEAQANLGVELQDFDTFRHARERLADLSERQMPGICSDLRDPTTKALYTAWRRQEEIAGELDRLLVTVRRHLAPALSRRVLDAALGRQQEALERTRDLRTAYPHLEGLPIQTLSEEQQRVLNETAEAQEQAAEELARAQAELQRQDVALSGEAISVRQTLRQAQQDLHRTDASVTAGEAAQDLRLNHTRQAERKQEQLVKALQSADAALAPPSDPSSRSSERLVALQGAAGQQAQALEETSRLEKGPSEEGLVRAARDQGEVSSRLQEMAAKQSSLKPAHEASESAKRNLVEGDMAAARQAQEKVLKALQDALQDAAAELSRAQGQELRSESATLEIDRLRALVRRQDELLTRTSRVPAGRAHALAREQAELARETEILSGQAPASATLQVPAPEALLEALVQLSRQAKTEAAQGVVDSERHLQELRRSTSAAGAATEEEDPETFYSTRELLNQAEAQVLRSRTEAQAAEEAVKVVESLRPGKVPEQARNVWLIIAESALRAVAAAGRSTFTEEQRQRVNRLQSRMLQTAALAETIGLPLISRSLTDAGRAMAKATNELANQRPEMALPAQREALAFLDGALRRLAAELGQLDLAALLTLLRDETANLTDAQARLTAETLSEGAVPGELASRQEELRVRSDRLRAMPGLSEAVVQALGATAARMRQAEEDLRGNRLEPARQAQKRVDAGLAMALRELSEAATVAQVGVPGTGMGAPPKAGKPLPEPPALEVMTPRDAIGPAWNVALPPRERGEVNQALKEKMPARYRRQIMLYYENLARVGLE